MFLCPPYYVRVFVMACVYYRGSNGIEAVPGTYCDGRSYVTCPNRGSEAVRAVVHEVHSFIITVNLLPQKTLKN